MPFSLVDVDVCTSTSSNAAGKAGTCEEGSLKKGSLRLGVLMVLGDLCVAEDTVQPVFRCLY